jgi:hypothetical protein
MSIRFHSRACALALALGSCACTGARSSDCAWPDEPAAALDLARISQRRHLIADARAAEQIAIHHADVTRGRRSGHFAGNDEYRETRDRCFAAQSTTIAARHNLRPAQVTEAAAQRDVLVDTLILLVLAGMFAFAANGLARRIFERFPRDEPWPALTSAAAGAVFLSIAGVVGGGLGATIVEMVRLGSLHMSYRAERLPWNQHWLALGIAAFALFSIVAAIRWRGATPAH